jgi:ATP-dependent helicase/nuclease subunit B
VDLVWAGGDASTPNLPSPTSAPEAQTPSPKKAWLRVVDYKLSPKKLDLDRVYHGLDLQLMIYLLAARDLYGVPTERTCAFYATILPLVKSKEVAPQREEPEEGLWWQAYRLRGIYPEQAAAVLDGTTQARDSPVVALFRKKDGGLGHRHRTDAVSEQDLNLLADRTVQRLRRIGLAILQGKIPVRPAQHRGQMPCTLCPWMAVCRFEQTSAKALRRLPKYSRNEVLTRLRGEGPCPT